MIEIGDLIRLNPEHHGGLDNLALVVGYEESTYDTVPRELTIHIQGVEGRLAKVYEDEVEVINEVLYQ